MMWINICNENPPLLSLIIQLVWMMLYKEQVPLCTDQAVKKEEEEEENSRWKGNVSKSSGYIYWSGPHPLPLRVNEHLKVKKKTH